MTASSLPDCVRFHDTELSIIDRDGQPWVTGPDIARALGMKDRRGVHNLWTRYKDEFTDRMATTVKMTVQGKSNPTTVRIFSPRGAQLIAMFTRTPKAKEFRRWVLDVLEGLEGLEQPAPAPVVVRGRELTRTDHRLINQRASAILQRFFPAVRDDLVLQAQAMLATGQVPDFAGMDVSDPRYFSACPDYTGFRKGTGIIRVQGRYVAFDATDWRVDAGARVVGLSVEDGRVVIADIADPLAGQSWFGRCMAASAPPGGLLRPVVVVLGRVVWEEGE